MTCPANTVARLMGVVFAGLVCVSAFGQDNGFSVKWSRVEPARLPIEQFGIDKPITLEFKVGLDAKVDAVEIEELTASGTWTKIGSANDLGRDGDRVPADFTYTLKIAVNPSEVGLYKYRAVVLVSDARAAMENLQDVWVFRSQKCEAFIENFAAALESEDKETLKNLVSPTKANLDGVEKLESALMQGLAVGIRQGKILEETDRSCRFLSRFQFTPSIDYEFQLFALPSGGWYISAL